MTSPDDLSVIAKAQNAEQKADCTESKHLWDDPLFLPARELHLRFGHDCSLSLADCEACQDEIATIAAALRLQREEGRREVMSGKLTLQQIAAAQGVKPLTDIRDLAGGLPDDFEIPVGHSAEADVLRLRTANAQLLERIAELEKHAANTGK
jgi:hypothetical protein